VVLRWVYRIDNISHLTSGI